MFNDVAVLTSEQSGGSNNTITTASADVPVKLQYSLNLANALNTSRQPVIQDINKVKIVALLIDSATGKVVNANKVKLGETTGIVNVKGNQDTKATIYDLMGRRLQQKPASGYYIQGGKKFFVK